MKPLLIEKISGYICLLMFIY